MDRTKIRWN